MFGPKPVLVWKGDTIISVEQFACTVAIYTAGQGPRGYYPMKIIGLLIGNFQKHPYKVTESHFVGMASDSFTPLRGTNSELTN